MSLLFGIAVFFVMWWVVLIAVLPWGVKTAQEAGEDGVPGQATSAPQNPMLLKKALWTTVVTAVLFSVFWFGVENQWVTLDDLPGPPPQELPLTSPKS